MSGPHDHLPDRPLSDGALDALFTSARQPGPADLGAADRFLTRFREQRADVLALPQSTLATRAHPAQRMNRWALLAATALSAAAMLGGALLLRPAPAAPSSEAYAAYSSALGEGW